MTLAAEIHSNKERARRGLAPLAPSDIPPLLIDFLERQRKAWELARVVYIDSADQATITECGKYKRLHGCLYDFVPAWKKMPVIDRINLEGGWLAHGEHRIVRESCGASDPGIQHLLLEGEQGQRAGGPQRSRRECGAILLAALQGQDRGDDNMRWMERVKNMIRSWLEIQPAAGRGLTIQEPVSHATNVLRNRVWYRGDASELDQLFKLLGDDAVGQARFWAAAPQNETIRKAHSGLPGIMVDTLAGVVKSDLTDLDFGKDEEAAARWQRIAEENRLPDLVSQAVADTLVTGDGAFKISLDTQVSAGPILEFWGADRVEYVRRHGRICAVHFLSPIGDRGRMLKEIYEPGSVRYALLDGDKEIPLDGQEEYADLKPVTFDGDFLLAVPLQFWPSARWNGRGQSIFDKKDRRL